jgi:hypothetical protein
MKQFLPRKLFVAGLLFFSGHLFATGETPPKLATEPAGHYFSSSKKYDTAAGVYFKPALKICACQVLEVQSTNHHHRNFALFAEKSNGRNLVADMSRISRVMTKEKKHMQAFFYDKLKVVNTFTQATDCRSMYAKLKNSNKSLVMYDILNADTRR